MYKYLPYLLILFIYACNSSPLDMSEEEIDTYIAACTDPEKIYDVRESLRFSKDDKAYEVTEYSVEDSVVLYSVEETTQSSQSYTQTYFKDGYPVYIESYQWEFDAETEKHIIKQRKIYLTGDDVLTAYEKTAETDEELEEAKYREATADFSSFDFERPANAMEQSGEFEMKFGEFLVINPDSYLILDNDKSGWGVALYIIEGDMLLDELFASPEEFQGKTIEVRHEFKVMNGIERMIYRGGILKE